MKCARIWIHMIGEPVNVCDLPEGHEVQTCEGRARNRKGEVVPGPRLLWWSDRSYRVAGEYVRRPELLEAASEAVEEAA